MSIEIALHRGAESDSLLNDHGFQKQWQALYERCPWGTVFQGPGYLGTWYDVYGPIYEPALVVSFGNCEELVGFLALAVDRGSGSLVIAGKPHAEYYGWLALPETSNAFIQTALDFLRVEFPKDRLDFRFLPPNTPLGWLHISSKWNRWCELTSNPRPLMAVRDGSKILESFRKKSNKSRLNRLERLGSLEFIRVKTFLEIELDFDDIMNYCDLRQGAVNASLPFRTDPYKKMLFTALFDIPEILHTTVWRLNGKVISAHIGFRDRNKVLLGLIAHSPFLAEHSPGKFHILHLGLLLAQERISELDLTPEGDYKDRFATHYDQVCRLTVYFSETRFRAKKIGDWARQALKSGLGMSSISPQRARDVLARCQHQIHMLMRNRRPTKAIITAIGKVRSTRERLILSFDSAYPVNPTPGSFRFRRDDLNDLLTYQPLELSDPPLTEFLSLALERLEQGDHVYTYGRDGSLFHYLWLREIREMSEERERTADGQFPAGSYLLDDIHLGLDDSTREWLRSSISHILQNATSMRKHAPVYALISQHDAVCREVLEELGFRCQMSLDRGESDVAATSP